MLPYHYLIIKNQILPSNKSNIPIFIIDSIDRPTMLTHEKKHDLHTRSNMIGDESVYYSIRGEPESISERIERSHPLFLFRKEKSAEFLRFFINIISIHNFPNGELTLQDRFTVGQFKDQTSKSVETESINDLINLGYQWIKNTSKEIPISYDEKIKAGFFPEIIRITEGRFPIIYIDSHLNPKKDTDDLRNFRKNLSDFLNSQNVTYIDLNIRQELNNSKLFSDYEHYNKKGYAKWTNSTNVSGIPLNSRIIAEEIFNLQIL